MSQRKFLSDISAGTAQALVSQCAGIALFFLVSGWLDKTSLGQLNWVLALLMVLSSLLGFGLDHLAVQKIATGTDPSQLVPSCMFHALVVALICTAVALILPASATGLGKQGFLLLACAQGCLLLAAPLRPAANGLKRFGVLFWMTSTAGMLKLLLMLLFAEARAITLSAVAWIYLTASFAEYAVCLLFYRFALKQHFSVAFRWSAYLRLIKEAFPLFGSTVLNTAIGRMDWLLLGYFAGAVAVAEYSFVNRVFELASLPLLVITPMLFPQMMKRFEPAVVSRPAYKQLAALLRVETVVSVWIVLALNIGWIPVMDALTGGKYGSSTITTVRIMLLALPLVYQNNAYWSILFARRQYRYVCYVLAGGFAVNLAFNAALIPLLHATGAAISLVCTLFCQHLLYMRFTYMLDEKLLKGALLPVMLTGVLSFFLVAMIAIPWYWQLLLGSLLFIVLNRSTGRMRLSDWRIVKNILSA